MFSNQMVSVWLGLSEADELYLIDVIKKLGEKYQAPFFTPHLTTYGNIHADPEIVIEAVKESVDRIAPFEIEVSKPNFTQDDFFKTVFIEFRENETLNKIYLKLKEQLSEFGEYILKPHISLIYKYLDEDKKKEIIENLSIKKKFMIGKIVVILPKAAADDWFDVEGWKVIYNQKLV